MVRSFFLGVMETPWNKTVVTVTQPVNKLKSTELQTLKDRFYGSYTLIVKNVSAGRGHVYSVHYYLHFTDLIP